MSSSREKSFKGTTAASPGSAGAAPGTSPPASVRKKSNTRFVPLWMKALAGAGPFILVSFAVFFFWLGSLLGKVSGGGSGDLGEAAVAQPVSADQQFRQQIQQVVRKEIEPLMSGVDKLRQSSDTLQQRVTNLADISQQLNDRVYQLETFSKEAGGRLKRVLSKLNFRGRIFIWFVHSDQSPFGRYHAIWDKLPQWVPKKQGCVVKLFVQENETVIAKWDSASEDPLRMVQTSAAQARRTVAIELLMQELKAADGSCSWPPWLPLSVVICAPIQGFGDVEKESLVKLEQVMHELAVDELWLVPMITGGEESPKGWSQLKLDLALVPRLSASGGGDLLRTLVFPLFLPSEGQGNDAAEDIEQLRRLLLELGLGEEAQQ